MFVCFVSASIAAVMLFATFALPPLGEWFGHYMAQSITKGP